MGNAHRKSLYFARFVVKFGFDFLYFRNYFFCLKRLFFAVGRERYALGGALENNRAELFFEFLYRPR